MPRKPRKAGSPTGLRRLLFRAPILLYRWRLGWLLGSRLLLLTHVGRATGKPRQVVLEVVGHNVDTGAVYVASGFGPGSQWYRNILHTPQVTVQLGRRRTAGIAQPLDREESGRVVASYARRHPHLARHLMRLCGIDSDGSEQDYYLIGRDHIPIVEITSVGRL